MDSSAFVADKQLIEALKVRSTAVDCSEDRILFRQGEEATGLFVFHRGEATVSMQAANGNVVVRMAAAPGSLLGLPGVIGSQSYTLSVEARKGAEVGFVSREQFSQMMLNEPALSIMILRVLAAEVRTARLALSKC